MECTGSSEIEPNHLVLSLPVTLPSEDWYPFIPLGSEKRRVRCLALVRLNPAIWYCDSHSSQLRQWSVTTSGWRDANRVRCLAQEHLEIVRILLKCKPWPSGYESSTLTIAPLLLRSFAWHGQYLKQMNGQPLNRCESSSACNNSLQTPVNSGCHPTNLS
jgi:hypothetical protein